MKKRELVSAILALMLLAGCASKTPTEPVAEPVPEAPVLEAREAYQLAEIPVQELHNGDEVTVSVRSQSKASEPERPSRLTARPARARRLVRHWFG